MSQSPRLQFPQLGKHILPEVDLPAVPKANSPAGDESLDGEEDTDLNLVEDGRRKKRKGYQCEAARLDEKRKEAAAYQRRRREMAALRLEQGEDDQQPRQRGRSASIGIGSATRGRTAAAKSSRARTTVAFDLEDEDAMMEDAYRDEEAEEEVDDFVPPFELPKIDARPYNNVLPAMTLISALERRLPCAYTEATLICIQDPTQQISYSSLLREVCQSAGNIPLQDLLFVHRDEFTTHKDELVKYIHQTFAKDYEAHYEKLWGRQVQYEKKRAKNFEKRMDIQLELIKKLREEHKVLQKECEDLRRENGELKGDDTGAGVEAASAPRNESDGDVFESPLPQRKFKITAHPASQPAATTTSISAKRLPIHVGSLFDPNRPLRSQNTAPKPIPARSIPVSKFSTQAQPAPAAQQQLALTPFRPAPASVRSSVLQKAHTQPEQLGFGALPMTYNPSAMSSTVSSTGVSRYRRAPAKVISTVAGNSQYRILGTTPSSSARITSASREANPAYMLARPVAHDAAGAVYEYEYPAPAEAGARSGYTRASGSGSGAGYSYGYGYDGGEMERVEELVTADGVVGGVKEEGKK